MSSPMLTFFDSYIAPGAAERVAAVLGSGRLSEGPLVAEFEARLGREVRLANPVAVNSGTSALVLALAVAGVGSGDEVILPAQTFVASGVAVVQAGATPVFVDIDYETGNIDPAAIEGALTERTRAVMPVHWAGLPADLQAIRAIAAAHGLRVVEDAAHAIGATYRGTPVGADGDLCCFSFQAIKHLTTGDGGAVCTPDPEAARAARARRWFGIDRESAAPAPLGERVYDLTTLGFKFHLNDYAAALGLANLEGLSARIEQRRAIAHLYRLELAGIDGLQLFAAPADRDSAHWLFGLHVERRDDFVRALADAGVPTSVVHLAIDRYTIFGGPNRELAAQRRFDETQIHIPIHDNIGEDEAAFVIGAIRKGW
jgi:perosamine synthetase